jgi:NAD(P)H-dependent FMN reductase
MSDMAQQDHNSSPPHIEIIIGSVRQPRIGKVIADWFFGHANSRSDMTFDVVDLAEVELPLEETKPGGATNTPISDRLNAADGYVIVTPEYNHSFPAALKNAIDWHYQQWKAKPVAFVSYGAGSGGIRAVEQLRLVFAELYATTTRNGVALREPWNDIDDLNRFAPDKRSEQAITVTLDELHWWATVLKEARTNAPLSL